MFNRIVEGKIVYFQPFISLSLSSSGLSGKLEEFLELFYLKTADSENFSFYVPFYKFENVRLLQEVRVEVGLNDRLNSIILDGVKYLRAGKVEFIKSLC